MRSFFILEVLYSFSIVCNIMKSIYVQNSSFMCSVFTLFVDNNTSASLISVVHITLHYQFNLNGQLTMISTVYKIQALMLFSQKILFLKI